MTQVISHPVGLRLITGGSPQRRIEGIFYHQGATSFRAAVLLCCRAAVSRAAVSHQLEAGYARDDTLSGQPIKTAMIEWRKIT